MSAKDPFADILFALNAFGCNVRACGSRVTNNPVPEGADHDFVVLVPHAAFAQTVEYLAQQGYESESNEYTPNAPGPEEFKSWRLYQPSHGGKVDSINLLLVTGVEFFRKHGVATNLLKRLNLPNKDDRIAVCQAVLYGLNWPNAAFKG